MTGPRFDHDMCALQVSRGGKRGDNLIEFDALCLCLRAHAYITSKFQMCMPRATICFRSNSTAPLLSHSA